MKLRGEDVVEGLRDWVKSELKEGPRQGYDLGKFFFSVSVGTIGVVATIEKLSSSPAIDSPMIVSLLALSASIVVSIVLVYPRRHSVGGETDLLEEYERQITRVRSLVLVWSVLWAIGLVSGAIAV